MPRPHKSSWVGQSPDQATLEAVYFGQRPLSGVSDCWWLLCMYLCVCVCFCMHRLVMKLRVWFSFGKMFSCGSCQQLPGSVTNSRMQQAHVMHKKICTLLLSAHESLQQNLVRCLDKLHHTTTLKLGKLTVSPYLVSVTEVLVWKALNTFIFSGYH